eukprot:TRINITY_DN501_c3_g1_i1.p1 TRINITY_DN501_c3_g1~~TRINITY_DN501_c3_g1_i1.p1  ORF type:complete len:627 (+),score=164.54 TRINITY_DN501_c3_g1_i1:67-1881(+)
MAGTPAVKRPREQSPGDPAAARRRLSAPDFVLRAECARTLRRAAQGGAVGEQEAGALLAAGYQGWPDVAAIASVWTEGLRRSGCGEPGPSAAELQEGLLRDALVRRFATPASAESAERHFLASENPSAFSSAVSVLAEDEQWRGAFYATVAGPRVAQGQDSAALRIALRVAARGGGERGDLAAAPVFVSALRRALQQEVRRVALAAPGQAGDGSDLAEAALCDRHTLAYAAAYLGAMRLNAGPGFVAGRAAALVWQRLLLRLLRLGPGPPCTGDAFATACAGAAAAGDDDPPRADAAEHLVGEALRAGPDGAPTFLAAEGGGPGSWPAQCAAAFGAQRNLAERAAADGSGEASADLARLAGSCPAAAAAAADAAAAAGAAAAGAVRVDQAAAAAEVLRWCGSPAPTAVAAAILVEGCARVALSAARDCLAGVLRASVLSALRQAAARPLLAARVAEALALPASEAGSAATDAESAECARMLVAALAALAVRGAALAATDRAAALPHEELRGLYVRLFACSSCPPYSAPLCERLRRLLLDPATRDALTEQSRARYRLADYLPAPELAAESGERLRQLVAGLSQHFGAAGDARGQSELSELARSLS